MRNIKISDKNNETIGQLESTFKWWIIAFLCIAWFCRNDMPMTAHESAPHDVDVLKSLGLI